MRVYRASSLGYSLCQLVAPHLGFEGVDPPEWLKVKFDEGHRLEPIVVEKLRDMGWMINVTQAAMNNIGDYQIEVELEVIPDKVKVVGHFDGQVSYGCGMPAPAILEIKSMAHKNFLVFKRKGWDAGGLMEKYKWQASAYMLAEGMPHCMVGYDKYTGELWWTTVTEPFYSISDIANKLSLAEGYIEDAIIPDNCTDYPCPYYYLHGDNGKEAPTAADPDLESIMAAWLEADKRAKIHEGEKDVLRRQIMELVGSGDSVSPVIKGACGVKVETYWQDGKEYVTRRKGGWVTKVSGPRK